MKSLIIGAAVAIATSGCAAVKANQKTIDQQVGQASGCVVGDLLKGVSDYQTILFDCAGSTLVMIAQDVYSFIEFYSQPHTAVIGASPFAGEPSPQVMAAWRKVYDDVRAKLQAQP